MKIELIQPTPAETLLLLKGNRTFRGYEVVDDAMPPAVILNQSRYLLTDAPLSYRWTIPFFIAHIDDCRIVGSIGGKGVFQDEDTVELGYNVAETYRRRGVATEAIRQTVTMAEADGLQVLAHVEPFNVASKKALCKNDFSFDATLVLPGGLELERWVRSAD